MNSKVRLFELSLFGRHGMITKCCFNVMMPFLNIDSLAGKSGKLYIGCSKLSDHEGYHTQS